MNFRPVRIPLLAALALAPATMLAPAPAEASDGCPRLPSSSALIIVIPEGGCGTAANAGQHGVTIIYGSDRYASAATGMYQDDAEVIPFDAAAWEPGGVGNVVIIGVNGYWR